MSSLTYSNINGYSIPNLALPEQPEGDLNRWGRARLSYLKQHKPAVHSYLMTQGTLKAHLLEIQQAATERVELITAQMAAAQGVTEDLKARDQMAWLGLMNSIRQAAEEQIFSELIYS